MTVSGILFTGVSHHVICIDALGDGTKNVLKSSVLITVDAFVRMIK